MGQHWEKDPNTGDYVMEGGAPKQTDSLRIPAYYRLKINRIQWLYAPNVNYGSDFYTLKKRRSSQDASTVENVAAAALQPIADDGRASNIQITTTQTARNGVALEAIITDAEGNPEKLVLPRI